MLSPRTESVPLSEILIRSGRRPIVETTVLSLMASFQEVGQLQAIGLRENDRSLIFGGHRIESAQRLGWSHIRADLFTLTDLKARMAELDENLARAECNPLQRAEQVTERKELYEELHPETRAGHAGAAARWRDDAVAETAVASFAEDTAARMGLSPRTVREDVQIGTGIAPEVKDKIRDSPLAERKADLLELARMEPSEQMGAADQVLSGAAASVREVVERQAAQDRALLEKVARDRQTARDSEHLAQEREAAQNRVPRENGDVPGQRTLFPERPRPQVIQVLSLYDQGYTPESVAGQSGVPLHEVWDILEETRWAEESIPDGLTREERLLYLDRRAQVRRHFHYGTFPAGKVESGILAAVQGLTEAELEQHLKTFMDEQAEDALYGEDWEADQDPNDFEERPVEDEGDEWLARQKDRVKRLSDPKPSSKLGALILPCEVNAKDLMHLSRFGGTAKVQLANGSRRSFEVTLGRTGIREAIEWLLALEQELSEKKAAC